MPLPHGCATLSTKNTCAKERPVQGLLPNRQESQVRCLRGPAAVTARGMLDREQSQALLHDAIGFRWEPRRRGRAGRSQKACFCVFSPTLRAETEGNGGCRLPWSAGACWRHGGLNPGPAVLALSPKGGRSMNGGPVLFVPPFSGKGCPCIKSRKEVSP